ncbi:hypothetical protein BGZ46_009661 [Entomortierella lignicola]|nr:hypothetical protein BGZ46_009661 [Entomortierella lignicola]
MDALQIPEILFRIAHFIPIWSSDPSNGKLLFHPQTLLSCVLVCRKWNSIFGPTLWFVYDHDSMAAVPTESLEKNLHLIRIAKNFPDSLAPTHIPNLIDLTMHSPTETQLNFINFNPQLVRLYWSGPGVRQRFSPESLLNLSRLTDLTLSRWVIMGDGFLTVMKALSGVLQRLSIFAVYGVDSSRPDFKSLELSHLNYLQMSLTISGSSLFEDFVRCCPNLQTLALSPEHYYDIPRLVTNIQACCPNLSSIINEIVILDEDDILRLINCCRILVSFECRVAAVSKPIVEALIRRRNTLQTLKLDHRYHKPLSVESLAEILQSCTELTSFSIAGHAITTDSELLDKLFQRPWGCLNLKVLKIEGYRLTLPQDNTNMRLLSTTSTQSAVFGWYLPLQTTQAQENQAMKLISRFLSLVFQHVTNLTKLQEIHLHKVEFWPVWRRRR